MGLFKKKATIEKMQKIRKNSTGESMDKLDKNGDLPFGWVAHNKKYVDMIEKDMKPFRNAISSAGTDVEKYGALKSFVLYLDDGKNHYKKINACVGKYFEEYIYNSTEAEQRRKDFKNIEKKIKGQK